MSIERFYTTTFTVYRMQAYVDNKTSLAEVGTFNGHLQQAGPDLVTTVAETQKVIGVIWCSRDEDVQVGDELTAGGDKYTVAAVQDNMTGTNAHFELHVTKA